jgi:hypothetical protein
MRYPTPVVKGMRMVTKIQVQQNFKIGIDIRTPVVKLIARRKFARGKKKMN